MLNNFFVCVNRALYEIMYENIVKPDTQHMTTRFVCIACLIPKATNTHSEYITRIVFPLQQWLHERTSCYAIRIIVRLVKRRSR